MADAAGVQALIRMPAPKSATVAHSPAPSTFEKIAKPERDKLLRLFSGRKDLASEFWDEILNELEVCAMLGISRDLRTQKTSQGKTPTEIKNRMKGVYNSARRLLQSLDSVTCNLLLDPPDGKRRSSIVLEERRLKQDMLKLLLGELVNDSDHEDEWGVDRRLSLRLDYVLASRVSLEVDCSDLKLSTSALIGVVFEILQLNAEVNDAIKGAKKNLRFYSRAK